MSNSPSSRETADKLVQQTTSSIPMKVVNRPEIGEIFIDSLGAVVFDGGTVRIDGAVTRLERSDDGRGLIAMRYTACRLVLTPNAALELINQLRPVADKLVSPRLPKEAPKPDIGGA